MQNRFMKCGVFVFGIAILFSVLSGAFAQETSDLTPELIPELVPEDPPGPTAKPSPEPTSKTIPDAAKKTAPEPESPYLPSIDALCEKTGLARLRKKKISPDTLEVRVWIYGTSPLQGIFVRRGDNMWSARHVPTRQASESPTVKNLTLQPEWAETWSKLMELGILTLPDDQTLGEKAQAKEGFSYVVEINDGGQYRIYDYDTPEHQRWPEAKKMVEIAKILNGLIEKG
jgi:hypothetical protein